MESGEAARVQLDLQVHVFEVDIGGLTTRVPPDGSYEVPRGSIAGGIGMGDYMYFKQFPQAASAVGIPAFTPSAGEQF